MSYLGRKAIGSQAWAVYQAQEECTSSARKVPAGLWAAASSFCHWSVQHKEGMSKYSGGQQVSCLQHTELGLSLEGSLSQLEPCCRVRTWLSRARYLVAFSPSFSHSLSLWETLELSEVTLLPWSVWCILHNKSFTKSGLAACRQLCTAGWEMLLVPP
jgi:hypothetical protein